MAKENPHIFLKNLANKQTYKVAPGRGKSLNIPERDRHAHGRKLLEAFDVASSSIASGTSNHLGRYIEFCSSPDHDLLIKSLEDSRSGITLLNLQNQTLSSGEAVIRATVYIPYGKEDILRKKILDYETEKPGEDKPSNQALVAGIENIRTALVQSFWTDSRPISIIENKSWCEIWLNTASSGHEDINVIKQEFLITLEACGIEYKRSFLVFPGRLVMMAFVDIDKLNLLLTRTGLLAEIKLAPEVCSLIGNESMSEQSDWIQDLLGRIDISEEINSRVFVLDTGVNDGHPLLENLVDAKDSIDISWATHDHAGHGTEMCGIVGYGDLFEALSASGPIKISHKIGSIKLLPPSGSNPKELWGEYTERAILRAEILSPSSKSNANSYCLAITATGDTHRGRPSSWSSAIDKIIYNNGQDGRIILISAGNTGITTEPYPEICTVSEIEDPAQSWNAITVGAITDKYISSRLATMTPVAEKGQISPHTRTSYTWEPRWPIKPEIVFEGGNILVGGLEEQDFDLLTTSHSFTTTSPITYFRGTSASTALAGCFLGKLRAKYPNYSAESIRGLVIHSAEWNDELLLQFGIDPTSTVKPNKSVIRKLLRHAGYGIPNLSKALYSEENSLSIIVEDIIQPYKREDSKSKLNEIHFIKLPWPQDELLNLGATPVKLRITLSYFIDPSPGENGWKDKYRYQSYGLNFDLNNRGESEDAFMARVNLNARDEDYDGHNNSGSDRWIIGEKNRNHGSIHSDIWEGTAADLALCNKIAVYPVGGWWKERYKEGKTNNRIKYSLIVSLETREESVELYTKIASLVTIQNLVTVPTTNS